MNPVILFIAGIAIGAKIVSCIFDELTTEEQEKQRQIKKKLAEAEKNYQNYIAFIETEKQRRLDKINSDEYNNADDLRKEYYTKSIDSVTEYYNQLIALAIERQNEKLELLEEITNTIVAVRQVLKGQTTILRRNSLQCLLRELEEAKEKIDTYSNIYLDHYIKNIQKRRSRGILDIPEPFSFTLPAEYFYTGKLIYMKKEDLLTDGSVQINKYESLKYRFMDKDFIDDMPDDSLIPVMCDDFIGKPDYVRCLSARKGNFKYIVATNPQIGITATVTGYNDKNQILLDYNDCVELIMPKRNLANEKRIPPIGAILRVYPTNWTHNLWRPVEVSEKTSDSYLCFSFDNLPIVFSEIQWKELEKELNRKNLLTSTGDWKIAPLDESRISRVEEVKLQLDNEICLSAKIINDGEKLYFSYNGLLDEQYYIKPEDVFVGIDCVLYIYLDSDMELIDSSAKDNMANLAFMCLTEFKIQYQTKMSRRGMQYFNKWAETTDKLITYLQKGKHTEIEIETFEKRSRNLGDTSNYIITVRDPEALKDFVDSVYKETINTRNVEFFFEISPGIYSYVSIKGDGSALYLSEKAELMDNFLKDRKIILLYQKSFPYAEFQQANALHQFRVGKLSNAVLQTYALDASNIQSERTIQNVSLFNAKILEDSSQLHAVEDALSEKNIFFIQGPPGTGKTTVIREIILQSLKSNPLSKILVVSQANVAVDNVLKGLLNRKDIPVSFVRCGHLDKIDERLENYSFEHIYSNYIKLIEENLLNYPNSELCQKWYDFIASNEQYNPNVGELIIKSKPIIGATCVGLAKKRIGLDRVCYDLVIIDEAGKALPAEILIPYIRGKKLILIGDHRQLPPTVNPALLDPEKIDIEDRDLYEDELFNISFFQRLFTVAPDTNKQMLTTQYRMPTLIGNLVSLLFYDNTLKNGTGTDSKKPLYFDNNITLINEVGFYETSKPGKSITNHGEVKLVAALINKIREDISARIAVITPYKGQKRAILNYLAKHETSKQLTNIDINTIDAFQGDEAEIVIFCCTRTKHKTNFFKDPRRINVAFSRAKNELIIIGSLRYFESYDNTSVLPRVAEYIKKHGKIVDAKRYLED